MTEKNADVEWLWMNLQNRDVISPDRGQRLLDHIGQLEADLREARNECESASERVASLIDMINESRPTVHEIAVQMMAALVASDDRCLLLETLANESYRAAEALVAEGRRRDGSL